MLCRNCQKDFTIYPVDQAFYNKINVPPPTHCPDCRLQRRLAYRNERTLYKRQCDFSGKDIISIYPPGAPFKVYTPEIWWSDQWDGLDYGRDFDFSRPFFDQFVELRAQVPRSALTVSQNVNCEFVNQNWRCKDSYMSFDMGFTENSMYCNATYHCRDVVDTFFARECELSYYLIDCQNCFNCRFLQDCSGCHEAYFSFDCRGCNNIAFCSNLRNQNYQIFNQPVSKEKFTSLMQEIKTGSYQKYREYFNDWREKVIKAAIHKENHNNKAVNCSGDYILNSKNCQYCYDCDSSEDLRYCNRVDEKVFNSLDLDHVPLTEFSYESACLTGYGLYFCLNVWDTARDCWYCEQIPSCHNCFGCLGLKHQNYCILNKQYTEEEYKRLMPQIIELMSGGAGSASGGKKIREWGEFFPIKISPFAYNETVAQEFFPLTKEQVLAKGWRWQDDPAGAFGQETLLPPAMPDEIGEVGDGILKEVLVCLNCRKNYKIITQELKFYREQGLPLPRQCNFCRHLERLTFRNPQKLWSRSCSQCGKMIETTYSADYPGRVYCEECYQKEIY